MLLSQAAGSVSSSNLSAFDVNGGKACEVAGTKLFPLKMRKVARGNIKILSPKVHHQSSVMSYSTDNRRTWP